MKKGEVIKVKPKSVSQLPAYKSKDEDKSDDKLVPYSTLIKVYDECAVDRFDELHRFFYVWYWISSVTAILLSTISGAVAGPNLLRRAGSDDHLHDILSLVGLITGIASAFILSLEKIVNLLRIAGDCKYARGELAYYLARRTDMPMASFNRISKMGLLCFKHPKRCEFEVA